MTTLPAPTPAPTPAALPHPMPDAIGARLLLLAIRRMGAHGLTDAHVAQTFLMAFGTGSAAS